jgi:hypothetical protein
MAEIRKEPGGQRETVLSTREARQARPGWPVLTVLIAALALCAIAFVVQMIWAQTHDRVPNRETKGVSAIVATQIPA